jgi:hypothetical protein
VGLLPAKSGLGTNGGPTGDVAEIGDDGRGVSGCHSASRLCWFAAFADTGTVLAATWAAYPWAELRDTEQEPPLPPGNDV